MEKLREVNGSDECLAFAYEVSETYGILNALSIMLEEGGVIRFRGKIVASIGDEKNEHYRSQVGLGGLSQHISRTIFRRSYSTSLTNAEIKNVILDVWNDYFSVTNTSIVKSMFTGDRIANEYFRSDSSWSIPRYKERNKYVDEEEYLYSVGDTVDLTKHEDGKYGTKGIIRQQVYQDINHKSYIVKCLDSTWIIPIHEDEICVLSMLAK